MPAPPRHVDAVSAKIVLLGESAVGKSSLALRFVKNEFHSNQETTIGAAYLFRTLTVPPAAGATSGDTPRSIKLEIWDTAGQERYRSLAPIYYRGAYGALVVYDITNKESLGRARAWVEELRANADPNLVIFLLGNKRDLTSLRQVPEADGRALADEEEVAGFYETSAKENGTSNVEAIFTDLATRLLDSGIANAKAAAAMARRPNAVSPAQLGEQPAGNGGGGCCGLS